MQQENRLNKPPELVVKQLPNLKDKKFLGESQKYKHVSVYEYGNRKYFKAVMNKFNFRNYYLTEKEAAIAIDTLLIKNKMPPVNTLKKN